MNDNNEKKLLEILKIYGHQTIEICSMCDGKGYVTTDIGTHTSEYEDSLCSKCDGYGRVVTYKLTQERKFKITDPDFGLRDNQEIINKLIADQAKELLKK